MSPAVGDPAGSPMVSVIITCYNLGRYLDEAVDSVLAQSYRDFELVLVDDGSTDEETCRLLTAYERRGIRVVHSDNRGLPAARNLGIAQTSAGYVCSVDADDLLEPTLLERSVAALTRDSSIAFVSHWLRTFGDETWDWTPERCDFPALLDMNTVNGAALVRRDVLAAVGGFDETMRHGCEDWDLWITIVERGFSGVILPEFLFKYRRRFDSMSRIMLEGDTHPKLYRRLVEKHVDSYQRHLPDLLLRREKHVAHLGRQIQDLELEQTRWLMPELAKARDDVTVLERRLGRIERWRLLTADRDRLQASLNETKASLNETKASLNEATSALANAVRRAYELDARANQAESAVGEMRQSLSWRLTAPLRLVWGALRRLARREP